MKNYYVKASRILFIVKYSVKRKQKEVSFFSRDDDNVAKFGPYSLPFDSLDSRILGQRPSTRQNYQFSPKFNNRLTEFFLLMTLTLLNFVAVIVILLIRSLHV